MTRGGHLFLFLPCDLPPHPTHRLGIFPVLLHSFIQTQRLTSCGILNSCIMCVLSTHLEFAIKVRFVRLSFQRRMKKITVTFYGRLRFRGSYLHKINKRKCISEIFAQFIVTSPRVQLRLARIYPTYISARTFARHILCGI